MGRRERERETNHLGQSDIPVFGELAHPNQEESLSFLYHENKGKNLPRPGLSATTETTQADQGGHLLDKRTISQQESSKNESFGAHY